MSRLTERRSWTFPYGRQRVFRMFRHAPYHNYGRVAIALDVCVALWCLSRRPGEKVLEQYCSD